MGARAQDFAQSRGFIAPPGYRRHRLRRRCSIGWSPSTIRRFAIGARRIDRQHEEGMARTEGEAVLGQRVIVDAELAGSTASRPSGSTSR
jgi:hypothetical protein